MRLLNVGESDVARPSTPLWEELDTIFVPIRCLTVWVDDDTVPAGKFACCKFVNWEPSPLK